MNPALLRSVFFIALPLLHLAAVTVQIITTSEQITDIAWSDVYAEALIMALAFVWLVINTKTFPRRNIFIPLYMGSYLFLLGMFEDVLDEIYDFAPLLWVTSYENIMWIGMGLIAVGLFIWSKSLVNREDLVASNEQLTLTKKQLEENNTALETHKKQLEQRNAELEKTLDDFYTMRLGMEKQIKEGIYEKENQKIKERLEELRAKKE